MPDVLAKPHAVAPVLGRHPSPWARPDLRTVTSPPVGARDRILRVIIVDDDDISRRGMAALLSETSRVEVLAAESHANAGRGVRDWRDADVVLVDAVDERRTLDQFPGVGIVEQVRHASPSATVMVITEHYHDDALRWRMREAGAHFFWDRRHLRDARTLIDAVLDPRQPRGVPGELDPESMFRIGVTGSTRVNRAVAFAVEHGLMAAIADRPQPRSRHWLWLRAEFNREARLNPVTTDGRVPERAQHFPSLPQIVRFLTWATRVKTDHPYPHPPTLQPSGSWVR